MIPNTNDGAMKTLQNHNTALINPRSLSVAITAGTARLAGELEIPEHAGGVVLFSHDSGPGCKHGAHHRYVAGILRDAGIGTFLLERPSRKYQNGHDEIGRLAIHLLEATRWLENRSETRQLKFGYFGIGPGAGAALTAAAMAGDDIAAVVSLGSQQDLSSGVLDFVKCPALLIVRDRDDTSDQHVSDANKRRRSLGVCHHFVASGRREPLAQICVRWFVKQLA